MPNKPGYYQEWYKKNRRAVAERRKKRYRGDTEYREKVLKRSSEYREEGRKVARVRVPRSRRGRIFEADGKRVLLFSVGAFAGWVNRSIQSLNHWEEIGLLPRTPYRSGKRGFRFYSEGMINSVIEVVGNKRRLYPVDDSMGKKIRESWESLGIPIDCEAGMDEAVRQTMAPTLMPEGVPEENPEDSEGVPEENPEDSEDVPEENPEDSGEIKQLMCGCEASSCPGD